MIEWWAECTTPAGCAEEVHLVDERGVQRHRVAPGSPGYGVGRITCPDCGRSSPNANDIAQGYCGACHWWTSDSVAGWSRRRMLADQRAAAGRHFDYVAGHGLAAEGVRTAEYIAALRAETIAAVLADPAMLAEVLAWDAARGPDTVG